MIAVCITGRVGAAVANELLSKGVEVKAIVRNKNGNDWWSKRGAIVAEGSLDDVEFLSKALAGADGAFVCMPPSYEPRSYVEQQDRAARAIADAVSASGVSNVVALSSLGADLPNPPTLLKGLAAFEGRLLVSAPRVTIIRPSQLQDNAANALSNAKKAGIYVAFGSDPDVAMPMVATRDIGSLAAYELLLPSAKRQTVDLLGPSYSPRQIAGMIGAMIGKKLDLVNVPSDKYVDAMTQAGMHPFLAQSFAELYTAFESGQVKPAGNAQRVGATSLEATLAELS